MSVRHFHTHACICSLAAAGVAAAQPVYEIGYAFNGGEEVVRVESGPFVVQADGGLLMDPERQDLALAFPFATHRRNGLVAVAGETLRRGEARPALDSIGRASVIFTDVVFTSPGVDPIEVDLVLDYGRGLVVTAGGRVLADAELVVDLEVELAGDTRIGTTRITFDDFGRANIARTGILEELPTDRHVVVEGLVVPVNTPVSLRIQIAKSISLPAGEGQARLGFLPATADNPSTGLPIGRPAFLLPDGVRADSEQAGIRDGQFILCAADLDGDGSLTIFDFLVFQNLFDAGDLAADFDGDSDLTLFDFLEFQNQFDAGCP